MLSLSLVVLTAHTQVVWLDLLLLLSVIFVRTPFRPHYAIPFHPRPDQTLPLRLALPFYYRTPCTLSSLKVPQQ